MNNMNRSMFDHNAESLSSISKLASQTAGKPLFKKRKGSPLSALKSDIPGANEINYKNPGLLGKFISEGGRILPSRLTGLTKKEQRLIKNAIKIARILALLPFVPKKIV